MQEQDSFRFFMGSPRDPHKKYWYGVVTQIADTASWEFVDVYYLVEFCGSGELSLWPFVEYRKEGVSEDIVVNLQDVSLADAPYQRINRQPLPWRVFYETAQFSDILNEFEGPVSGRLRGHWGVEISAREVMRVIEAIDCLPNAEYSGPAPIDKDVLDVIRTEPAVLLSEPKIVKRLAAILTEARWGRSDARKALEEHLIQKKPSGCKTGMLPNVSYGLGIELMKRLSAYLSKKCKFEVPEAKCSNPYDIRESVTPDLARRLPVNDHHLMLLIRSPRKDFVNDYIQAQTGTTVETYLKKK